MEENPKKNLLDIRNLSISFRSGREDHPAVEGVSLSMGRGETLGIVGESGSGKSVTALSVMGLLPVPPARIVSGEIIFSPDDGRAVDLLSLGEKALRRYRGKHLSMVFQEPMTSLNPVMRCGKQVMEVLTLHDNLSPKAAADRTLGLFEEVRLPRIREMFSAWPHQLSGGQKQRVMIAMAMACKPALLIADEPTTALDVTVQRTILDLLAELQQRHGISIMLISHDLSVVRQVSHRIAIMYRGKIVETGPAEAVFSRPSHAYTRGLMACRPPLHSRPVRLPTVQDFLNLGENPAENLFVNESQSERESHLKDLLNREPLVSLQDVSVSFPVRKNWLGKTLEVLIAVDRVTAAVYPGETLGLVGESGCGKTTLGRAVLALVTPSGGTIRLADQDLTSAGRKTLRNLRKKFQIIFQDPYSSLNPRLSAGAALTEPMKVHGIGSSCRERENLALELLQKVGLEKAHFFRYPHEFSGGQRQRLCIARALALRPAFIVCDESVSALDISIQAQVLNLLNDLKKEFGFTYVFISHDLSVVKYMSDRIIVMKDGKIVEQGEADALYARPGESYTRSLIDAIPGREGWVPQGT